MLCAVDGPCVPPEEPCMAAPSDEARVVHAPPTVRREPLARLTAMLDPATIRVRAARVDVDNGANVSNAMPTRPAAR